MRIRRDTASFLGDGYNSAATASSRHDEYAAWLSDANITNDAGDTLQVQEIERALFCVICGF
jgi:hypothetical protein